MLHFSEGQQGGRELFLTKILSRNILAAAEIPTRYI